MTMERERIRSRGQWHEADVGASHSARHRDVPVEGKKGTGGTKCHIYSIGHDGKVYMNDLRIALLQLLPADTTEEQLQIGLNACQKAKELGANIALFPEMWSCGYRIPTNVQSARSVAVSADSAFVRSFARLAAELRMAIGITFLESYDPAPLNSLMIFDANGGEALHYSKVHTCEFDAENVLSRGRSFEVADLDTGRGTIEVGAMICFDREFPESARILMLKGAELILVPNACPMEINRLCALRTRAYENMLAVATCNYPAGQPDCNGHSTIFDGVAWHQDEPGVRDMCILEAPRESGIYVGNVDIGMLREYRAREVMGKTYRHPEDYGALVSRE